MSTNIFTVPQNFSRQLAPVMRRGNERHKMAANEALGSAMSPAHTAGEEHFTQDILQNVLQRLPIAEFKIAHRCAELGGRKRANHSACYAA